MNSIITRQPEHSNFDAFVWAMFLLWARCPRKSDPESDGSYWLGEIGNTRLQDQRMERETPYSVCKGIREE
jgi:hypothetical protein